MGKQGVVGVYEGCRDCWLELATVGVGDPGGSGRQLAASRRQLAGVAEVGTAEGYCQGAGVGDGVDQPFTSSARIGSR